MMKNKKDTPSKSRKKLSIINKVLEPIFWDRTYIERDGKHYTLAYKDFNGLYWSILSYDPQENTLQKNGLWGVSKSLKPIKHIFGRGIKDMISKSEFKKRFAKKMNIDPRGIQWK